MQLWGGAGCLAGGGSLGSQQTCQIKLVPLTIAGYQALTGDNTTQRSQNISKYHDPCDEGPGIVTCHIVSPSPIVSHTHRGRGWPWPSLMLRSGLLAEAGLGEAGWHWGRHNTTHSHNLLIRTVITVSMLRITASWSTAGTLQQSLQAGSGQTA